VRVPLYREAQGRLRAYIAARGLGSGDPLPPEAALAQELGMSRLSLREATKSLETLGVVKAVAGKGLYVGAFSFEAILDQLPYGLDVDGAALAEVLQVREAMEGGLVVRAAAATGESDLDDLSAIVDEMAVAWERGESLADIDRRFHLRLFAPLGNTLVTALLELFWDLFHRLESALPPGDRHSVDVHRAIVAALRADDPAQLVRAMDAHFDGIRRALPPT
jgi:DNA-binding FadR family transcriptional regulator